MKDHTKIWQSLVAGAGAILYPLGLHFFNGNPLLSFLMVLIIVPMVQNFLVLEIIHECREQHRLTLENKFVRRDLLLLLLTVLVLWVVQYFSRRL